MCLNEQLVGQRSRPQYPPCCSIVVHLVQEKGATSGHLAIILDQRASQIACRIGVRWMAAHRDGNLARKWQHPSFNHRPSPTIFPQWALPFLTPGLPLHLSPATMANSSPPAPFQLKGRTLDFSVPRIMGVINATPDSFFGASRVAQAKQAAATAVRMVEDGADILDIGGQSSRPGAEAVGAHDRM